MKFKLDIKVDYYYGLGFGFGFIPESESTYKTVFLMLPFLMIYKKL
jgi:hypothetical protein